MFQNSPLLCYGREDTIEWSYILQSSYKVLNIGTTTTECKSTIHTPLFL